MNAVTFFTPETHLFPPEAQERLKRYLDRPGYRIPAELGDRKAACSIAAINLAISGRLTASTPACMSRMIGEWIVPIQDAMPEDMRNSERWKTALVSAAGSGRKHENERLDIIMDWMWETALPIHQPTADANGYGDKWRCMYTERSIKASLAAKNGCLTDAAFTARFSHTAGFSTIAADLASRAARWRDGPYAASAAAHAATAAAKVGMIHGWTILNPIAFLERLVRVGEPHG